MPAVRIPTCDVCGVPVREHWACVQCEMLLHETPPVCSCGRQHGLPAADGRCRECVGWED